jgi:hypothetical protein
MADLSQQPLKLKRYSKICFWIGLVALIVGIVLLVFGVIADIGMHEQAEIEASSSASDGTQGGQVVGAVTVIVLGAIAAVAFYSIGGLFFTGGIALLVVAGVFNRNAKKILAKQGNGPDQSGGA